MVANRVVARPRGEQNPAYEPAHPHTSASQCPDTADPARFRRERSDDCENEPGQRTQSDE
jgi:hypothetical protein